MESLKYNLSSFSSNIENAFTKIFRSLDLSEINNSDNYNFAISRILENPSDELLFNDTIEFLKQHKEVKNKEISLSNNSSLTLSLE